MGLAERQLNVNELEIGMFVARLDRPWSDTDFLLEGVFVRGQSEIDHLARFCQHVYIDETRSDPAALTRVSTPLAQAQKPPVREAGQPKFAINPQTWKQRHCIEHYQVTTSLNDELVRVEPLAALLEHQISVLCQKVANHRGIEVEPLVECTTDLMESIIRNPDALAWLTRIQQTRKPVYMHVVRLGVWAGIVGRQLGLNRFALVHLTMAVMMTGIGKSLLGADALARHNVFNHSVAYRQHIQETIYHLKQTHFSCMDILTTIEHYCERHNGSGYPAQKSGEDIPFFARVAGLIDTFEFLVHPFNNAGISPANAIGRINRCKGKLFDAPLVETFVRAIGIYPTGSVVEISNGQVGMVVSNSYEKRLQASVIPLMNATGTLIKQFRIVDLDMRAAPGGESGLMIKRSLPARVVPPELIVKAHQTLFASKTAKRGLIDKLLSR